MATYAWPLPTKQTNLLPGSSGNDAVTLNQLIANTSTPAGGNAALQFNNSGVLGGSGNLTYNPVGGSTGAGLLTSLGDITSVANVSGNFFIGNGSLLTGIVSSYGNANVTNVLASGNITTNVITTGNASASYFIGNGSLLTGIVSSYGNANVSAYLAAGTNLANIITAGNVQGSTFIGNVVGTTVTATTGTFSNASVSGNLTVLGNLVTANVTNISVANSLIELASNNTTNIVDIGFYGSINPGVQQFTGLVRDATDGLWKLFSNVLTEPTSTVSFNSNTVYDGMVVGTITSTGAIATTGNVTATGNIQGSYVLGNGAFLTGLPAGYGNSNVAAYLPTYTGALSSLTGNVTTTANISGSYILGNGALLTGLPATYSNVNVQSYLNSGTNIGNVTTVGNVSGSYILGNAAFMTGIPTGNYSNTNVISLLSTLTSNVTTTANVQASYFIGNGSQLTGLPASYTDANVTTLLSSGNVTTPITTTGNVNAGNLIVTNRTRLGNIANITITGGNVNQVLATDGTGNLSWANPATVVPAVYFIAPATGNNQSFGNVVLSSYANANVMTVFYNGALLSNRFYTLSGPILTVNINLVTGDTIDVIAQTAGNVVNVISGYGDSNVASYLAGGTNLTGINTGGPITAPLITGTVVNTGANSLAMNGNRLYTQSSAITIDPSGDGSPNTGAVVVLGNLLVAGTLTYNDATSTVTSNLLYQAANSASTAGLASGGGLAVGPAGNSYATWTFNSGSNSWQSNLPITAVGINTTAALTGTTGAFTGNVTTSANLVAPTVVATNVNTTTVTATGNVNANGIVTVGNISGSYILGNGSLLTGIPALNSIIAGTSNVTIPVNNSNINFTVGGTQVASLTADRNINNNEIVVANNNDHGGADYAGIMTMTNTNIGAVNPNKFIRLNPSGELEVVDSSYSTTIFSLSDSGNLTLGTGSITANDANAFIVGSSASSAVGLNLPNECAIRNYGDNTNNNSMYFDVNIGGSNNGQFKFRGTSSYTEYAIISAAGIQSQTPYVGKLGFSPQDTELTVDNYRFRITTGNVPQIISNTGGTVNSAWTNMANLFGGSLSNLQGTNGVLIPNNSWTSVYTNAGINNAGDNIVTTLLDKSNNRQYRVTWTRNDSAFAILVERIL